MRGICDAYSPPRNINYICSIIPAHELGSLKLMCIFDEIIQIYDKVILTLGLNTARKTKSLLFSFYLNTFIYSG